MKQAATPSSSAWLCWTWACHGAHREEWYLLECDEFPSNQHEASSNTKQLCLVRLAWFNLQPWRWRHKFLHNFGQLLLDYTASSIYIWTSNPNVHSSCCVLFSSLLLYKYTYCGT
jgi:hypothetical protein